MGQSRAGAPGMEARHLHLAARRCCPPSSQHGQPRAHRTQARATVWIRENWHHLPCFWRRRQRAVIALRQEHHLRRRFWSSVRTPWRHAVGALHQLDHLLKQGRSPGNAADRHRHQPRHRHPPARRQLRAHRRVPHRLPPGVRLPDAPALRVDAALRPALRRQVHQQEVPGLSVGSAGRGFGPRCRRVRRWAGDAFQRSERE
ncbi:hypothetical protein BDA96_01G345300 [Sorghum bicolor]|uniref:Uncharacterized protein n=1 Tax=Sorghum bicolor TaxID=4558 RepID=A0A921S2P1_SORBI|nr:hypothetical protein BDA96_01G345300 [Sorghum bicolor]